MLILFNKLTSLLTYPGLSNHFFFTFSMNSSYPIIPNHPKLGGGERTRTDDPLLAKQVLYHLSYTPSFSPKMVGRGGLEPPTPRLSSVCSNQLSYQPQFKCSIASDCSIYERIYRRRSRGITSSSLKGGDPAAGSPTATLLRLHPSHRPHRDRLPLLRVSSPA